MVADVDLTIDKSHSGSFTLGVNGTLYACRVERRGHRHERAVTVTDVLPAGLGFVSAAGTGWTCTNASGTVTCTRATALPAAGAANQTSACCFGCRGGVSTVTNTASVSGGGEPAANNGNNSDSDPTTVLAPT